MYRKQVVLAAALLLLVTLASPVAAECAPQCDSCATAGVGGGLADWAKDWIGGVAPSDSSTACVSECSENLFMSLLNPASVGQLILGGCSSGATQEVDVDSALTILGPLNVDSDGVLNLIAGMLQADLMNINMNGLIDLSSLVIGTVDGPSNVWGDLVIGGQLNTEAMKVYANGLMNLMETGTIDIAELLSVSGIANIQGGAEMINLLVKDGGIMDVFQTGDLSVDQLIDLLDGVLKVAGEVQGGALNLEVTSSLQLLKSGMMMIDGMSIINGPLSLGGTSFFSSSSMDIGSTAVVTVGEASSMSITATPVDVAGELNVLGQLTALAFNVKDGGRINFLNRATGAYKSLVINPLGSVYLNDQAAALFDESVVSNGVIHSASQVSVGDLDLRDGSVTTVSESGDIYLTEGGIRTSGHTVVNIDGGMRGPSMSLSDDAVMTVGSKGDTSFLQWHNNATAVMYGKFTNSYTTTGAGSTTSLEKGSAANMGVVFLDGELNVHDKAMAINVAAGPTSHIRISADGMLMSSLATVIEGRVDIDGGALSGGQLLTVKKNAKINVKNGGAIHATHVLSSGEINMENHAVIADSINMGCRDDATLVSSNWPLNITSAEEQVGPRVIGGRGTIRSHINVYSGGEMYTGEPLMMDCNMDSEDGELVVDGNIILHSGSRLLLNSDTKLRLTPGKVIQAKAGSRIDIMMVPRMDNPFASTSVYNLIIADWLFIQEATINVFGVDGDLCVPSMDFAFDVNAGLAAVLPMTSACMDGGNFFPL